jgi:NAD(P)-dependent dehydrogenase (short-subunit alcohol dehydrogenase family)
LQHNKAFVIHNTPLTMSNFRKSTFFPRKPTLTEDNLPDQTGKVFIITGGNSGVGKELARMLFQHNAKVYIAARSQERSEQAIADIKQSCPNSIGELVFLKLVLDDLSTIQAAAHTFIAEETRLDVLWNNAGVMRTPVGSKSVQGYELQLGTNSLGHFLFVQCLTPLLIETAKTAPRNSVRVVWVSSIAADLVPKGVIDFNNMDYHVPEDIMTVYARSKAGNLIHAAEFDRRYPDCGVVSLSLHPGFLRTNLQNDTNSNVVQKMFIVGPSSECISDSQLTRQKYMGNDAKYGAYTELFAGMDASITPDVKWGKPPFLLQTPLRGPAS